METTLDYHRKEQPSHKKLVQPRWQRIILLCVLGYEAAGCLMGGILLIAAPDGSYLDMPVDIMHDVFSDFMIPGLFLFGLGILNTAAFFAVLRKKASDWIMAGLALGGLLIWFWIEIAILQELHWLHAMWGLPVVAGFPAIFSLVPSRQKTLRHAALFCGILSSLLYAAMLLFVPMQYQGYSSVTQTISELSAIGAPTRPLWVSLGIVYTLLVAAFGWGIWQSAGGNQSLKIAGRLLTAYGIIGIAWVFAPMHQREVLAAGGGSMSDTMHLGMGIISSLFMIISMAFAAAAFGKRFRFYTIATIAILVVSGALTGLEKPNIEANLPTPLAGVWERIMLGIFMLWAVVFSVVLLRAEKKHSYVSGTEA